VPPVVGVAEHDAGNGSRWTSKSCIKWSIESRSINLVKTPTHLLWAAV